MQARIIAVIAALAAVTATAGVSYAADSTPRQGVGIQLLDNGPSGAPCYGSQDAYIGTCYYGNVAQPIAPGGSRTYTLEVTNTGDVQETVNLIPASATDVNGAYVPSNTGVNWVSQDTVVDLNGGVLDLAPGDAGYVAVTVYVPSDARPGTGYGVVWASVTPPGGPGNVKLAIQSGVREYLTVS